MMQLNSSGCAIGFAAVGEVSCEVAASSLGVAYLGSGSDSGAPAGCYYLSGDSGRAPSVSWNTFQDQPGKTWRDVASVCRGTGELPALVAASFNAPPAAKTSMVYSKMQLNSSGCASGFAAVIDELSCDAAATFLGVRYEGSRSDGGAPRGCYYLAGDDGRVEQVAWNIHTEQPGKTWWDVSSVCQKP